MLAGVGKQHHDVNDIDGPGQADKEEEKPLEQFECVRLAFQQRLRGVGRRTAVERRSVRLVVQRYELFGRQGVAALVGLGRFQENAHVRADVESLEGGVQENLDEETGARRHGVAETAADSLAGLRQAFSEAFAEQAQTLPDAFAEAHFVGLTNAGLGISSAPSGLTLCGTNTGYSTRTDDSTAGRRIITFPPEACSCR